MPRDPYYSRTEVSNSDLTALKEMIHPSPIMGDRDKAFRFGTLFDALVTEPARVNHYTLTVDDTLYSSDDFRLATEMHRSLRLTARHDPLLDRVLREADTQCVMIRQAQQFAYGPLTYTLPTRCKWDWWLPSLLFGGDLKSTAAATQAEFDEAVDRFDWDRSRAWYMDIARSDRDFIYAVSKRNCRVFRLLVERDEPIYTAGRDKYEELAFQYWLIHSTFSASPTSTVAASDNSDNSDPL